MIILKIFSEKFMKISIGTKIKDGPWGGGNLFAINLKEYLTNEGHKVVHNLDDDDIDIILITEPRRTSESSAFTHIDVQNYIKYVNSSVLVVHRINECDERKNTNYVNKYMIQANNVADYTIFVSSWLKDIYIQQGINQKNNYVIFAGANPDIFNSSGYKIWDRNSKMKIVTHHWGANWNKGFDIYQELDNLLDDKKYDELFSFTYIGNIPKNFKFKNAKLVSPLSGIDLSNEIKKHQVYLTGSINEPSGNHHIEGAQCGLPLLYLDSGGTPEYCNGYGVKFENDNFNKKLDEIYENYDTYLAQVNDYPFNSKKMCLEYEKIFNKMLNSKTDILNLRSLDTKTTNLDNFIFNLFRRFKLWRKQNI